MMVWGDQRLSSPINVKVSDEVLAEFSASDYDDNGHHPVEQMLLKWDNAYPNVQFFNIPTQVTSNHHQTLDIHNFNDAEMGIYLSRDWFPDISSSALAITQFYGVKRSWNNLGYLELIHADIILNYRYHNFSLNKNDFNSYYLPSVLLHEIGHFLGLSHQRDITQNSIMQPYMSSFDSPTQLSNIDIQTLTNNYNKTPNINPTPVVLSRTTSKSKEGEVIRGVIELHKDGTCRHYVDGKLVHSH